MMISNSHILYLNIIFAAINNWTFETLKNLQYGVSIFSFLLFLKVAEIYEKDFYLDSSMLRSTDFDEAIRAG